MSLQQSISVETARALLAEAGALGETVKLSHHGGAYVTLKCVVMRHGDDSVAGHARKQRRTLEVLIPTQAGFEDSGNLRPVTFGDRLMYGGRTYFVSGPIARDVSGQWYNVRAEQAKTQSVGMRN